MKFDKKEFKKIWESKSDRSRQEHLEYLFERIFDLLDSLDDQVYRLDSGMDRYD